MMRVSLLTRRVLDVVRMLFSGRLFKEISEVRSKIKNCIEAQQDALIPEMRACAQNVKVSVVIPTLNESEYICNPLQSLKAGKYHNFEVVVVDCMSDDDTVKKARRFGAQTLVSKKRNIGYQTHLGFVHAKGDIIIRTDADTIFPKDVLVKTAEAFKNEKTMIYHVSHLYYDGNILLNLLAHLYDKYWRETWATTGHFIAVRREAYEKVTFRHLLWGQDYDFGKRAYEILGSETVAYDPHTLVLSSSRAIKKIGLLKYLLRGGSFKMIPRTRYVNDNEE